MYSIFGVNLLTLFSKLDRFIVICKTFPNKKQDRVKIGYYLKSTYNFWSKQVTQKVKRLLWGVYTGVKIINTCCHHWRCQFEEIENHLLKWKLHRLEILLDPRHMCI